MELPGVNSDGLLLHEIYHDDMSREQMGIFKNTDFFFQSLYRYHRQKGLVHIILTEFFNVLLEGFIIAFSTFLLGFVKWDKFSCNDESSCSQPLSNFIISSPLAYHSFIVSFLLILYIILFAIYWMYYIAIRVQYVIAAFEMDYYYREKLGITLENVSVMTWNDVLLKVIQKHNTNEFRIQGMKEFITEHDVVLRIMRKENYMIALINKQLLNIRLPWWIGSFTSQSLFLTKSLEWSLSFCVLDFMFTDQYTISIDFLRGHESLEQRLYYVGVVHLVLLPFMVIFMIIQFFLLNTQQFNSSKAYLGPRQWSPLAMWTFREFNELPHVFEDRIEKSYAPANAYIALFYNPYLVIVARFVSYIAGAFVAVLLLVSVVNESVLLHVHAADHNLLWFLGIFTAIFAAARSMIPPEPVSNRTQSSENSSSSENNTLDANATALLEVVALFTHYYPSKWIGAANAKKVKDEFIELFPFKVQLFAMEIFSVILTPIVLCFSLPESSRSIIGFVRDHSKYVDGVGAVCDYSLFDIAKYGNEKYGAPADGETEEADRPRDGKLEQSYLNFRQTNPFWKGDDTGRAMEERLHMYRVAKEYDYQTNENLRRSSNFQSSSYYHPQESNTNLISSRLFGGTRFPNSRPVDPQPAPENEAVNSGDDYSGRHNQPAVNRPTGIFNIPYLAGNTFSLTSSLRQAVRGAPTYEPISEEDNEHPDTPVSGSPLSGRTNSGIETNKTNINHDIESSDNPNIRTPLGLNISADANNRSDHFDSSFDRHQIRQQLREPERKDIPNPTRIIGGWSRAGYNPHITVPPSLGDGDLQLVSPVISRQTTVNESGISVHQPSPFPPVAHFASSPIRATIHHHGNNPSHPTSIMPTLSRGLSSQSADIPSALRSILQHENIDYENDFYWMTKFKKERVLDPVGLERSFTNSRMLLSGMTSFTPNRGFESNYQQPLSAFEGDISMGSFMINQASLPMPFSSSGAEFNSSGAHRRQESLAPGEDSTMESV